MVCDVTHVASIETAVERVLRTHGRIDVLVNNAGVIQVGPAERMTLADYERGMATHFWGPFHTMNAVIPAMRTQRGGHIVNIASLGGMVAIPHLAPYCASKFALVGLSDALRAELAKDRIRITTVCPGLMRTGSHLNVEVKGRHAQEFAWLSISAGAPFVSMDARRATKRIVRACRFGDPALHLGLPARALIVANAVAPSAFGTAMKAVARLLPRSPGGEEEEAKRGYESRSRLAPSFLTRLADRAAARNNELRGHGAVQPD
jgi:NAD(P)-dependent dehydrogenase (short-subunit alcohol dehydrogenase family)